MHAEIESIAGALAEAGLLAERRGVLPRAIDGITDDSRAVEPGWLFVAVRGTERDGHDFLDAAAKAGADAEAKRARKITCTWPIRLMVKTPRMPSSTMSA